MAVEPAATEPATVKRAAAEPAAVKRAAAEPAAVNPNQATPPWRTWLTGGASLGRRLLFPKPSPERVEAHVREAIQKLPTPVFWLLGKAQSGKTSLVRALTGSSDAEIGDGFRPCTRTARSYPFPSAQKPLVEFLDTRGLGEVDYDPAEDLALLSGRAHLVMVVVRALDHAQQAVLDPLQQILHKHPHWPIVVVQTCLHEAYPGQPHIEPYPFETPPYPASVPEGLSRSLAAQRSWFAGRHVRFVPVDFTLPEDGFAVPYYGLDALWSAIDEALPWGLRGMIEQVSEAGEPLRDRLRRAARGHILSYSLAAGATAALPLPLIDIPLVLAIQAKLMHSIALVYGQRVTAQRLAEIGGTLGVGFLARLAGRELLKLVPGLGSVVAGSYAAATTYAMGELYCQYFSAIRHGYLPDADALRRMYAEQFAEGQQVLAPYLKQSLAARDGAG